MLGPPGAGKGTQAKLLSEKFNIPHISTGGILRDEVSGGSELGNKAQRFITSGELVPDEIVVEVVLKRLNKPDAQKGFILDGFPRTLKQAEQLSVALSQSDYPIDLVIYFATSTQVSIKRLSGRRVCKKCGANFHLTNMPPKSEGICDFCGGELYLRDDDKEKTIERRLTIYQRETSGLIDYYKNGGKLIEVSGDSEAGEVNAKLLNIFAKERLSDQG